MREIIFDTETTGLDAKNDRIIEIGGVELENRFITGRTFHVYVNPEDTKVHPDAYNVHGISNEDLIDKPVFKAVIEDWLQFTDGAKLVAHNASFDVGFFNAEYERVGLPIIDPERVIDTLQLARRRHPMGPNSLDALCRRYGIDNSRRTKHGALLDSELLAEVYIELTGGKQAALGLTSDVREDRAVGTNSPTEPVAATLKRPQPLAARLTAAEIESHEAMIARLPEGTIWNAKKPAS